MQRCKTCTYWQPEQAADGEPFRGLLGAGVCGKAPQIWDVTDDVDNQDGWSTHKVLKPEHAAILAVVEDGSAYTATLITMPDFGCVQHQPK